jgi:hypothetical protein
MVGSCRSLQHRGNRRLASRALPIRYHEQQEPGRTVRALCFPPLTASAAPYLFVFHTSVAPECPAITISATATSATGTAATYNAVCSLNGSR